MAGDPSPKRILLVEGTDDEHFVQHFCTRCGIAENFSIESRGGFHRLRSGITGEIKMSGRRAVGILVDADENARDRWQKIVDELDKMPIKIPIETRNRPGPTGTVIEGRPRVGIWPRVGVWLMPDNRKSGELEDFVKKLIPAEDSLWPLATQYIASIPESDRKFQSHKALKAGVHAWLAAQKKPGRIGLAVRAGALNADDVPLASDFATWLRDLFGN